MLKEKENPINKSFKIQTRFPFCLVWTALPCITTIFPLIGHTGVCRFYLFKRIFFIFCEVLME